MPRGPGGATDKASVDDPQWIQRTYNQMKANDGVALTYCNTTLNSVANWALSTAAKKNAFHGDTAHHTNALRSGTPAD